MKKILTERHEQVILRRWLDKNHFKYAAIPNSTYTPSYKQMNINRAMGVSRGFPDMIVLVGRYFVFIELKRQKKLLKNGKFSNSNSSISDEQLLWICWLSAMPNSHAKICYGAEEAINFVKEINNLNPYPYEEPIRFKNKEESNEKRDSEFAEFLQPNEREQEENRKLKNQAKQNKNIHPCKTSECCPGWQGITGMPKFKHQ